MKIIYVAGPCMGKTISETRANIRRADIYGEAIVKECKFMPFVPHVNTVFYDGLADDKFFFEGNMEFLRRCDAVFFIPGWEESAEACAGKEEAEKIGLPIFMSIDAVKVWGS